MAKLVEGEGLRPYNFYRDYYWGLPQRIQNFYFPSGI